MPIKLKSLIIIVIVLLCQTANTRAEIIDRVVAVVNDDIITLSELNDEGQGYFQAIIKNVPTQQLKQELQKARQEVLNILIDRLLIRQQADKYEMQVSDEEVDQTIEAILMKNNISADDFRRDLARKGTNEPNYRKKLKSQMLRSRLVNFEIRSKIVVSSEEIKKYYDTNYSSKPGPDGYHIQQIGIQWGKNRKTKSQEEARQMAEYVHQKLGEGTSFTEMAKSFSNLPSAEDGGDIGVFNEEEMADYMKTTILAMHPGETSSIIETPVGYQIFKLISAKGSNSSPAPLAEVEKEIKGILYNQEMEKDYDKWLNDIRDTSFIKQNL